MDDFVHIPIRVPAAFAERIDNYWHGHRLMSRAAAVRVLLTWALDTAEARVNPSRPGHPQDRPHAKGDEDKADQGADQES